jgi:hypothetical protein
VSGGGCRGKARRPGCGRRAAWGSGPGRAGASRWDRCRSGRPLAALGKSRREGNREEMEEGGRGEGQGAAAMLKGSG